VKAFLQTIAEQEINEIIVQYCQKRSNKDILNIAADTSSREIRIELAQLDPLFDRWLIENEAMSGVLNQGLTKKNNIAFRQKLEAWKRRKPERKRI